MNPDSSLGPAARVRAHQRRTTAVQWIRRTHGWFGLWGAVLGLLFGFSGIWLNHRNVLKLPQAQERTRAQLALPDPVPDTPEAMSLWLQGALRMSGPPNTTRIEPAKPVAWADKNDKTAPVLTQPAHWLFNFGGPNEMVQAEYWQGNRSVGVNTTHNGFVATLTNMHKGGGMPLPWILLVDTLAGSLIFLSLSGVALWMLTHRRRRVGLALFGASLVAVLTLALTAL
ncbi:peptidase [Variovorax sp. KBW07]|uniref:PepSY-associated TM helix domain-containing protein n=1 Tax=Variovorax sp. KBW07 TaxID=2153358 RepID=UPI000F580529|nr:PepSY-associated TM helix domain-containing protein [Variovorax sp. KBW07]RQO62744.1 peptidase [Variovorax sp. KBW07]